jgi:hypothetical protein
MPAFEGKLTDEQVNDLLIYLLGEPPPEAARR